MLRYRERDFEELEHADGVSPAWPIAYATWSPGTAAPSGCSRSAVRPARIRPSPRTPRPTRIRPCPTSPRSPPSASGWRLRACIRSRCRSRSTSTAGCAAPPRHGTPFPTPAAASSMPRRHPWPRRCAARTSPWSPARYVERLLLAPDGRRIEGVEYRQRRRAPDAAGRHRGPVRRRRQLGRVLLRSATDRTRGSPTAPASSAATS